MRVFKFLLSVLKKATKNSWDPPETLVQRVTDQGSSNPKPDGPITSFGAYIVYRDPNDSRDICFAVKKDYPGRPPEVQTNLYLDVESALRTLRALKTPRFNAYFESLLSLAQGGLAHNVVYPEISQKALEGLKTEIVLNEASIVKNRYMQTLGGWSALYASPTFLILALYYVFRLDIPRGLDGHSVSLIANFYAIWLGAMVGAWLSFGVRKPKLTFEDLVILEEDQMEPHIRLIFTGLLTLTFGFLFYSGAITVSVGSMSTNLVGKSLLVSILIGVLAGISEKALPSRIASEAGRLFSKNSE